MSWEKWVETLGLFLVVEAIIYLLFSFYRLSVNPALWSEDARAAFVCFSSVWIIFLGLLKLMDEID